jgi:2-isopropylmalate synthase
MTKDGAGFRGQGTIGILDATLREGEQTPGVYFDPHVRMAVSRLLDEIGVDVIEAGHPVVGGEVGQGIGRLAGGGFRARIGAHARALRGDIESALECGVDFLGIFLCISPERLRDRGMTLGAAIECLIDSISFAREHQPGLVVRFTPEDAVRSPLSIAVAAAAEAVHAGADIISVADTTGEPLPRGVGAGGSHSPHRGPLPQ